MTDPTTPAAPEFDFGPLCIEDKTARFPLPWFGAGAFLELRPANDANPAYNLAVVTRALSRVRQTEATAETVLRSVAADSDDDRKLYPECVVIGWGGIKDKRGELVPFSVEAARLFFAQLPEWIMARLRLFASRPESFVGPLNVDAFAGNS
jgi:hypothetical protein